MTPRQAVLFPALAALVAAGACDDERLDPVASPAPTEAPSAGGAGGGPDPGPKVRDVFFRNPVGVPYDNLLADGDFELSIVPGSSGQYGWIFFSGSGVPVAPLAETGGLCRSGLRCARVKDGSIAFGRGTAAPDGADHRASIWMKPVGEAPDPAGGDPCDLANVYVVNCSSFDVLKTLKAADAPAADGWCELSATFGPSTMALCFYAEIGDYDVLVDAATLLPEARTGRSAVDPLPVVGSDTRTRMEKIRHIVRSRMPVTERSIPVDPARRDRGRD